MFSLGGPTILWRLHQGKLRFMVNLVCMLLDSMFSSFDTFFQLDLNTPYHTAEKLSKSWAIPLLLLLVGTHFLAIVILLLVGMTGLPVVSFSLATL
jgi:hypothetical protein